jgi:hypothetical protein
MKYDKKEVRNRQSKLNKSVENILYILYLYDIKG